MSQIETPHDTDVASGFEMTGGYERFRRSWIHIRGDAACAGQTVKIWEGERLLGQAQLVEDGGRSVARLELPMPPIGRPFGTLTLRLDGDTVSRLNLPDADEERMKAFEETEIHFAPYVFNSSEFPPCDFEQPSLVEDLIGRYTLQTRFYGENFNPVEKAETVGRYGAIVEVKAEDGRIFKRFRTLYRKPDPTHWWQGKPSRPRTRMVHPEPIWYGKADPLPLSLPQDLGIDPAVVHEQATTLTEYLRGRLQYAIWDDPWTPVLLAGLHETSPGDGDLRRNNAWERDRRWWVEMKRRTGDLKMPHLLYLPKGYEDDPEKRWPLVLFLHGSGAIGHDLNQVLEDGTPPKLASEGKEYPFILVAPQSPSDEWFWSPAMLNALLDDLEARYRIDPDRITVTGLSMGGRGTWVLAIEYPDRFAAIAPICGSIPEPSEMSRIRHLPIWAFVGAQDHDQSIRELVDALQAAGGNARLTVYPDAGHDAWTPTYTDPAFYEWLLSQRRQ